MFVNTLTIDMIKIKGILSSFLFICLIFSNQEVLPKSFSPAGKLDGMVLDKSNLTLIQLNLKNDSLYQIANSIFPDLDLLNGPATYHRIIESSQLLDFENYFSNDILLVLNQDYTLPDSSRLYWTETKQGNNPYGTWTEDGAIEYTCACIENDANECIKLGYDESWYNPFDYWADAWWDFTPPYYDYIQEIRVTVRGAQCDALPLWSESYMGLKDDNNVWSYDYELSVNYTDNTFIVPFTFNNGILMPTVGSDDNYVVDFVRYDFFYSCINTENALSLTASDSENCSSIDISWELDQNAITTGVRLYRDSNLIYESSDLSETSFTDFSVNDNFQHEYCIETLNNCSSSDWICGLGSVKNVPETVPIVTAQDGLSSNHIEILWEPVDNVDGYRVYRDSSWLSIVYPHQSLRYIDEFIEGGEIYNYCIESFNDCGNASWQCDEGFSGSYLGDSNSDGSIDVLDVVSLVNFILSINEPSESQLFWMDMNQDSSLNVQDVVLIVNIILN